MQNFLIKPHDRVFICGKTGSGKTYLSHALLKRTKRLIVLDGKGTLNDWNLEPVTADTTRRLRHDEPVRIRVRPGEDDEPTEYFLKFLEMAYRAGNCLIYIDELYAIIPPGQNPPPILFAIYTRGRELGIGTWATTQRPVWVPLVALSEAEHFFMFRLSLEEDRRRLAAFLGPKVIPPIRDIHGFFYARAEWDNPRYYSQLEV